MITTKLQHQGAFRALAVAALSASGFAAMGQAIIDNGVVQLGVDLYGQLNVEGPPSAGGVESVGLRLINPAPPGGWESTSPGCLCEGWGVAYGSGGSAVAGSTGWANNNLGGNSGLSLLSFTATASTAVSVTEVLGFMEVTHDFHPSAATPFLYEVTVTIKNTSGAAQSDVRYTRLMDWDIEPTAFSEYVTIAGTGTTANLLYSDNNGFDVPDPFGSRSPLSGFPATTDVVDFGPDDHGALFDFGFGALADGESKTFHIYYGAAPTELLALGAVGAAGLELFSFGQQNGDPLGGTPATHIFGFKGVGGVAQVEVPEPGTYAAGLFAVAAVAGTFWRRRRQD